MEFWRVFFGCCLWLALASGFAAQTGDTQLYRQWIEDMKTHPRGPFKELRWYCKDGSIFPPKEYACRDHGGGHQHGAWSEQTESLRESGYLIASLLAGFDPEAEVGRPGFLDFYNQLLIEKFLLEVDDGWILRKALFYRGAIQEEDERAGARALLIALSAEPEWIGLRYPALRIGSRLLSHGKNTASVQKVRQLSASLSDIDPDFKTLRGKIHGTPEADDANRVRDYATQVKDPELRDKYAVLASEIDAIYAAVPLPEELESSARIFSGGPWLQEILRSAAAELQADDSPRHQYRVTAQLLADLRDALPRIVNASARLRVIDLSLAVENANFAASAELREQVPGMTRRE
ncbi:MAG: phosphoenolpyruvate synthase, partial [Gammaproteobacteria bacterium]